MKKTTFFGLLLGGWLAVACSDTDRTLEKYISDTVEITDTEILVSSAAKNVESTIITSDHPWSIEGGSDWCTISPTTGGPGTTTVQFKLLPNETYDDRSITVTLHSSAGDKPLTIYQKKKDAILFSRDRFDNIPMNGGEIKVEVQTNVAYRVEIPSASWITHASSTRTRGLTAEEETFAIASTSNFDSRSGIIVFINEENEKHRDTVTVYQVQRDQIILSATSARVPLEGETIRVPVRSNIVYEVNIPSSLSWIHEEPSSRADEIVLRVEESFVDRFGVITIRDKNNHSLSASFTIDQQEKETLKFSNNEGNIAREGGKFKIIVEENISGKFRVVIPEYATWIRLSASASAGLPSTASLTLNEIWIDVDPNGMDDIAREGKIFLQGTVNTDLLDIFTLYQAGGREPEQDERKTLLKIAEAMGGLASWTNQYQETWLVENPLNKWSGVTTDASLQHVTGLAVSTTASGSLPKEIGDLIYLESLKLYPAMSGPFPPQIANLKNLQSLDLSLAYSLELVP